jgi:hypothetical protein
MTSCRSGLRSFNFPCLPSLNVNSTTHSSPGLMLGRWCFCGVRQCRNGLVRFGRYELDRGYSADADGMVVERCTRPCSPLSLKGRDRRTSALRVSSRGVSISITEPFGIQSAVQVQVGRGKASFDGVERQNPTPIGHQPLASAELASVVLLCRWLHERQELWDRATSVRGRRGRSSLRENWEE